MQKSTTGKGSRKNSQLDDVEFDLPPFPGFDRAGLKFLKELKENNDREWFTEHKPVYEDHLLEPMRMLLGDLRRRFREEGLNFHPDPKKSIFRIYRDTRFSKDKRPYKTNIGAAIPFAGEKKEGVGNYIHIDPGECFYGGGAYFMDAAGLRNLREKIAGDTDRIRGIIADLEKNVGPVHGEKLKRGPAGYDRDHPAMDLLLYTQMWASARFPDRLATSPELVDWIVARTHDLNDFNTFLYEAIRGARPEGL